MPRVAYFSNQFATKEGHGIARYAHHLFNHLQNLEGAPSILPVAAWSNLPPTPLQKLKNRSSLEVLPWGRRVTPFSWTYLNSPPLESGISKPIDLVHAVSLGYSIATRKPYIVTVHDIGPLTHPEYFTKKNTWVMGKSLKQAIQKAEALICVSEATADDLSRYVQKKYGVNLKSRLELALEGVDDSFFKTPEDQNLLEEFEVFREPFILAVGKISPRKNLQTILKAMAKIKDNIPHHLVTVGGDGWAHENIKKSAKELGIQDRVHFLGYVSDPFLHHLYHQASVFVYPSLFEGFGLTVLEAMAVGCPVITSNLSSLPEVAGEAALLVNPRSVKELSDAIESVCLDPAIAKQLSRAGKIRASKFTWESCAQKVNEVYQKILI